MDVRPHHEHAVFGSYLDRNLDLRSDWLGRLRGTGCVASRRKQELHAGVEVHQLSRPDWDQAHYLQGCIGNCGYGTDPAAKPVRQNRVAEKSEARELAN